MGRGSQAVKGIVVRRIAEDTVQDPLRLALHRHVLLVHADDPDQQVHALLPGDQLAQRLADADREGRGVPAVLLHDRPLRRVERHAVDVQVARQLALNLLLAHLVAERPGDVMHMGRQLFFRRITFLRRVCFSPHS